MSIEDWLTGFLDRHRMRFAPHDWPQPETEEDDAFMGLWLRAFTAHATVEDEADEASADLGPTPPRFRNDHLPAVLEGIKALRIRRAEAESARRAATARALQEPDDPLVFPAGINSAAELWRKLARDYSEQCRT